MNRQTQTERLFDLLSDGRWHSGLEIRQQTGISYPPARIQDLQKRGWLIEDRPVTLDGYTWKEYRLMNPKDPAGERSPVFKELQALKAKAEDEKRPAQLTLTK